MRNQPYSRKAPFAFVHIPKCSGTAFENYIYAQRGAFELTRAFTGVGKSGEPESLEMYFKNESASCFIFGHFNYQSLLQSVPQAFMATFLRDPVKRTISHYKSWHDKRNFNPDDPHYQTADPQTRDALIFAQQATLEEFVSSDNEVVLNGALGNQQTLYLSSYPEGDMQRHLESAKKNLATFDFFGITEHFVESLELLRLMIPDLSDYQVERDGENRSSIALDAVTQRAIELIAPQVEYDQQLYEYACQLFKERLQEWRMGSKPTYSVKWFAGKGIDGESPENAPENQLPSRAQYEALQSQLSELKLDNEKVQTEIEQMRPQLAQLELKYQQLLELTQHSLEAQHAQIQEAAIESGVLRTQLTQLAASHSQLSQAHTQILESRTWRLFKTLGSVLGKRRANTP